MGRAACQRYGDTGSSRLPHDGDMTAPDDNGCGIARGTSLTCQRAGDVTATDGHMTAV
jgi:hypothetical protein